MTAHRSLLLAMQPTHKHPTSTVSLLYCVFSILLVSGNAYLKDNLSQDIRMQNKQMIICEEISAPPVDHTDIFATRMYATISTLV